MNIAPRVVRLFGEQETGVHAAAVRSTVVVTVWVAISNNVRVVQAGTPIVGPIIVVTVSVSVNRLTIDFVNVNAGAGVVVVNVSVNLSTRSFVVVVIGPGTVATRVFVAVIVDIGPRTVATCVWVTVESGGARSVVAASCRGRKLGASKANTRDEAIPYLMGVQNLDGV